jgi:hypothetical protein
MDEEITSEMQSWSDLDRFMVDFVGQITHFASGGCRIPASIAVSLAKQQFLDGYIRNLPDISDSVYIE